MKPRQGLGRENSPNSICRFVLFLHLIVKPLGMNVNFYSKNHAPVSFIQIKNNNNLIPVITIIGVPFIVLTFDVNRVFKQRRFGATLVKRK